MAYEHDGCVGCVNVDCHDDEIPCCNCHGTELIGCHNKPDLYRPVAEKSDNVNHPSHYEGNTSLECIDVMELVFGTRAMESFCVCNAFKYLWRHKHKNGKEDLEKARWYLNRAKQYTQSSYIEDLEALLEKAERNL